MKNLYDLIIIGAGPAGMSAAIYAGRSMMRTLVLYDGNTGGQISITEDVVNYPGIATISGAELTDTMRKQAESFGVEVKQGAVTSFDFQGDIKTVTTSTGERYESLGVIVTTGARPRKAGFQGEDEFIGRGIGYCATCDGEFFKGMDIFVVGGGFAAAEEALFLTRYAKHLHILVRSDSFTCSPSIVRLVEDNEKITVHYNSELRSVEGDSLLRSATISNDKTGEQWIYRGEKETDTFGIFVFTGYEPLSDLFSGHLEMDQSGYILTDEDMQTNISGIYAAGDVRPKKLRQLVTAVSDGAIASTVAEKYIHQQKLRLDIKVAPVEVKEEQASATEHLLDADLVAGLQPILDRCDKEITLQVIGHTENPTLSLKLKNFAEEIAALSPRISFQYQEESASSDPAELLPLLTFLDADQSSTGLYFHGVPSGHEFNSFVLALYNLAGPGQEVSSNILERINKLSPATVYVAATLGCTMCPDAVQASQLIARHNPAISAHMIDLSEFPSYKEEHQIMSVPAVRVGDGPISFGRKGVEEMLALLESY